MALVVVQDWPKDMDNRQQRTTNTPPTHNDRDAQQQASNPYAQPSYGYPQPWNANMNINGHQPQPGYFPQMQFYPQHYPHQQQAFTQAPMFDPNHQFAQWAYQHMMFNAQQTHPQIGQIPPSPLPNQPPSLRGRSGSHSNTGTPTDFYQQQVPAPFAAAVNNRYPGSVGTPPPHSSQSQQPQTGNYQGFHPYRRPERGERPDRQRSHDANGSGINNVPFQPPYARQDAAGSTTSLNSTNSSTRSRTNSGNSGQGSVRGGAVAQGSMRGSKHQPSTSISSHTSSGASSQTQQHIRGPSSSSSQSSTPRSVSNPSSSTSNSSTAASTPRVQRPSPLSQGSTFSAAERRKSRDDSDIAAMLSSQGGLGLDSGTVPTSQATRSNNGLKGRLRRALSFSTAQTLREEEEDEASGKVSRRKDKTKEKAGDSTIPGGVVDDIDDDASTAVKKPKKSLRMFNARFNASTDNISLSSTVSSASVMIRKLGNMGRIARRNSLAGITSLFKDKDKNKDKDGTSEGGKKLKGKAETGISHVTAELDRSSDYSGPGMEGLSPAAKLARQHTLKSNAEAAARAKALQEAQAAAAASASSSSGPTTWEKNTITNRNGSNGAIANAVREDGLRLVVEDDSDEDEPIRRREHHAPVDDSGSDEESTWRGHGDEEDEDLTIRIGMEKTTLAEVTSNDGHDGAYDDEVSEPWATNVRRSVERTKKPAKGILKNANAYTQEARLDGPNLPFARVRANSYDDVPNHSSEAGPLARMPSPDPDHIDGLHKHGVHNHSNSLSSSPSGSSPLLLPPLSFDNDKLTPDSPQSSNGPSPIVPEKGSGLFNHPGMNNSEPALSTIPSKPPTLTHRSATSPGKRLAFATNLSIYNTFSSSAYDRRSEPATWSRLTPALAQRIKEELNSYKMEEMEVHAASRVHTQFFV